MSTGWVAALGALVLLASGAQGGTPALRAVTSTTVLADFVRAVGGEDVQVTAVAPAGADPHTFQPTPQTMRVLEQAQAVFFNGAGLEEWWGKVAGSLRRREVPVVELSQGLATLRMPAHGHGGRPHGENPDPHAWLDPTLAKRYVERIRDTLGRVDPARAGRYAERATAYQAELDALDEWIRAQVATIPPARRRLVTFHNAFQYLGKRYGLAVDFLLASPGREPSAKALAELTRRIRQERVPAVFAEADFNPKLLEVLAKDAGVRVVTNLYDGSLTDGPPADTYLNLMRHNVRMIVGALK
ncbi:MAG: metal ABC transporter substrate-binding protein [Candidatus Methylomirabilales bacterium]